MPRTRRSGQIVSESHWVTSTEPGGPPPRSTATTLTDRELCRVASHGRCKSQTDVGSPRRSQAARKEPTSVAKRISPCERLHAQIDEVFAGGGDLAGALEEVA